MNYTEYWEGRKIIPLSQWKKIANTNYAFGHGVEHLRTKEAFKYFPDDYSAYLFLLGVPDNARAGLIMPGTILLGSRYYQEIAPDVALDKAELVSMNQTVNVPAGKFNGVIQMNETSDLEPGVEELK